MDDDDFDPIAADETNNRLSDLLDIARAVAEPRYVHVWGIDRVECAYCEHEKGFPHAPTCPHTKAVELLARYASSEQ